MYRLAVLLATLAFLPLIASAADGAKGEFVEGIEYERVVPAQPVEEPGKVEVLELFWYGCPHCYHLEPMLEKWRATLPKDVVFRRMPAIFSNPRWELHARAFYTAEALGVLDEIHVPLFEALHKEQRKLANEDELAAFFAQHGVKEEDFKRTFNSFYVTTKVNNAKLMTQRYGIDGVPAMIVDGKYRTDGPAAGSQEGMLRVVDFLIAKERGGQ
jgi:thiol:disulfide interchange protein DsbA